MIIRLYSPLLFVLLFLCSALPGQQALTLEKIWASSELIPDGAGQFNFLQDSRQYTRLLDNTIFKYDLVTGKEMEIIYSGGYSFRIQSYQFSQNEQFLLLETDQEQIYRRSRRSSFYVWDKQAETMFPVSKDGKQMHATFSPDGTQVAFVRDNNVWISDYRLGQEIQVTQDGEVGQIINGSSDWVYEEEFRLVRGFEWSPDGTRIAYYRFDESEVPSFMMTNYRDEIYPEWSSYKYPKVGQKVARVGIQIYDLASGQHLALDLGPQVDQYIPRMVFTTKANQLCVTRINRLQDRLDLILFDVESGASRILLTETNKQYINLHDHLRFLTDGQHFIWTSEMDGWNHIYLYDMKGHLVHQLTNGNWEVTDFYGVDEKRGEVWFQSARQSPIDREICRVSMTDGAITVLPSDPGFQSAQLATNFDVMVHEVNTINTPATYSILDRDGAFIRLIQSNGDIQKEQKLYGVQPVDFFSFEGPDTTTLHGWMIKPARFDPEKSYPLLMYVYGGPGRQEVTNDWMGQKYWWFQYLAASGMIIAAMDGRGSGARGEAFKKMTTLQLGHYETIDQIAAARYLGALPYVDADRIGIYGWSYGGFLSALCLFKGHNVFRAGISIAPVTNWKWYDAIYTERYMQTEETNGDGYSENSPIYFADLLQGDFLLVHGFADDNVHFQNTAELSNALVDANKQFDSYVYFNQAHSLAKGNARLHLYTKMTDFLDRSLRPDKHD
ncbi:MAG: S9 family peptidase [Saprospiraceae bacterium]|nr:S9 family peptidase [Saprospiraceae bacterium]